MGAAVGLPARIGQVLAHDNPKCRAVVQVVGRQCHDAKVQLHGVGFACKRPRSKTPVDQLADGRDQGLGHVADHLGAFDILAPQQIFIARHLEETRVVGEIIVGEFHQLPGRGHRITAAKIQPCFLVPDRCKHAVERGNIQLLFAAEVMIDHPRIAFRCIGDPFDPRAVKPVLCEFLHRDG